MKCIFCSAKTKDPIQLTLAGRTLNFCSPECYVTAGLHAIGREYQDRYGRTDVLEMAKEVKETFFHVY